MSTDILPSKREQTPKLCSPKKTPNTLPNNQKHDIPFSQRWFTISRLQTCSFLATIAFKPVSICRPMAVWALPSCFANISHCCSTPEVPPCARLCWGTRCRIYHQGSQTLRSWKLGFVAPFSSFQLKIIGLLENWVRESARKSLLFHTPIGNAIGTASTSFLYWMKSSTADLSSFACLADGRASATLIAARQDSKRDNTLKRWPRMKRLDESRRTLTWTDYPHTLVTASEDSKAERGLVQACRRFVTES